MKSFTGTKISKLFILFKIQSYTYWIRNNQNDWKPQKDQENVLANQHRTNYYYNRMKNSLLFFFFLSNIWVNGCSYSFDADSIKCIHGWNDFQVLNIMFFIIPTICWLHDDYAVIVEPWLKILLLQNVRVYVLKPVSKTHCHYI